MTRTPHAMSWNRRSVTPRSIQWKAARLEPVEPAVHPRRAVGHHQVGAVLQRVQQRADALGLHLEVGRQGDDHVAPAALDPEAERGRLAERPREGQQAHRRVRLAQGDQLRRGGESAVEDEEELVLLAAPLELAGEGVVEQRQVVRPLHDRDDHGDEPRVGGPGRIRTLDDRLHESSLGGHDQRTSHAVGMSRALSRSLLSATSATSPSMAR